MAEGNLQEKVQITQSTSETVIREKKNNDGEKEKVPVKITVKKKKEIEVADLLEMFQSQLSIFKRHFFNIKSQFSHYRELRRNMSNVECLLHVQKLLLQACSRNPGNALYIKPKAGNIVHRSSLCW